MSTDKKENWDDLDDALDGDDTETEDTDGQPPIDHDPDDFEATYTVQTGMTGPDGTVYKRGDSIKVRCDLCAMWNNPLEMLGGKPLCAPGHPVVVDVEGVKHEWRMAPDRYSCRRHFVPLELNVNQKITKMLTKSYGALMALKWAFPAAKAGLKLQGRVRRWFTQHNPEGDVDTAVDNAVELAMSFYSQEQVDYVQPLVTNFVDMAKASKRAKKARQRRKRVKLEKGSTFSWAHRESGERVQGFLMAKSPSKKTVTFMVGAKYTEILQPELAAQERAEAEAAGEEYAPAASMVTYSLAEWRASEPVLVRAAVNVEVSGSDGE